MSQPDAFRSWLAYCVGCSQLEPTWLPTCRLKAQIPAAGHHLDLELRHGAPLHEGLYNWLNKGGSLSEYVVCNPGGAFILLVLITNVKEFILRLICQVLYFNTRAKNLKTRKCLFSAPNKHVSVNCTALIHEEKREKI